MKWATEPGRGWRLFSPPGAWTLAPLLLLTWLAAGCALTPPPGAANVAVPPAQMLQRYAQDQRDRLAASRFWRVRGVLELETSRMGRRNRFLLHGETNRRALLLVHGPMNQVAMAITLEEGALRMVDALNREAVEVPSTMAGLEYLTGLPIPPQRLLSLVLALAEPLTGNAPDSEGWWQAQDGEQLRLDPAGHLLERRTPHTTARYQWSDPPGPHPAQLVLEMAEAGRLEALLERWENPVEGVPPTTPPPQGFPLQRPFQTPEGR